MKRNADCGFTNSVISYGRFSARRASSEGIEHDESSLDGGETEDEADDIDSGVDGFNELDILDAKAP